MSQIQWEVVVTQIDVYEKKYTVVSNTPEEANRIATEYYELIDEKDLSNIKDTLLRSEYYTTVTQTHDETDTKDAT